MSAWKRFLFPWRSGNQQPPKTPVSVPAVGGVNKPGTSCVKGPTVTYMRSELPAIRVDDAFAYGKVDGHYGVSSEHYRSYVGWKLEEERLEQLLNEAQQRLSGAEERLRTIRNLPAELAGRTEERRQAEPQLAAHKEKVAELERALAGVEEERRKKASRGSLFSGTLYAVVAIVFMLADVIVAQKIVADALKFTNGQVFGINESWLFAVGLAMVSVLLKPVYERLVEEKYLDGTGRRTYAWVMISVSFMALATLFVMGSFRSEAFALQSNIDTLIRTNGDPNTIRELGNRLASSRLGAWANVLSGILFAVSGAVCLGMGMRHYQDFWVIRRPLARESEQLRIRLKKTEEKVQQLSSELASKAAEIHRLTAAWLESPEIPELVWDANRLCVARDQLLSEYKAASRSKIRSVYSDGYNLGYLGQPDIDEEELSSPHRALRRAVRLAQLRRYVGAEHEEDSPTPPDGDSGSGRPPSASESAKTEAGEAAWHPSTATTTHKVRLTPGIPVFSAEEPVSEQLDTGAPNMAIDSEADTEGATYSGVEAETGEVPVAEADEEQSSAPASSAAEVDQPEPTASPEQSPESTLIKPSLEMRPEEGSRDAGDGEVRDVED